jgi:hypothetical protein
MIDDQVLGDLVAICFPRKVLTSDNTGCRRSLAKPFLTLLPFVQNLLASFKNLSRDLF